MARTEIQSGPERRNISPAWKEVVRKARRSLPGRGGEEVVLQPAEEAARWKVGIALERVEGKPHKNFLPQCALRGRVEGASKFLSEEAQPAPLLMCVWLVGNGS